jgi:hypothetical protein
MNQCPICFTTNQYHRKDCPNHQDIVVTQSQYVKPTLINNKEQYEEVKKRVDILGKELEGNWFVKEIKIDEQGKQTEELTLNKDFTVQMREHETLAQGMLNYEIENNLLPI